MHESGLRLSLMNFYIRITIHHRNLQKFAIEMYKIENNLSPVQIKGAKSLNEFQNKIKR